MARTPARKPALAGRLALLAAGALAGLLLAEAVSGLALPANDRFLVWPPNVRRLLRPDPDALPGIGGESRFETSAWGLRADEWSGEAEVAILALGGSTTECLMLDQDEAWPALVQHRLDREGGGRFWVGNAGKSGMNSRSHLLQIEHLPPQLPRLQTVVALVGGNDLLLRLRQGDAYDPHFLERPDGPAIQLATAFHRLPEAFWASVYEPERPFYKKTALWRLMRETRAALAVARRGRGPGVVAVQDRAGRHLAGLRRERLAARPLRAELPDLAPGLGEYRRNLERMAELAAGHSLRLVLATQPALWEAGLPAELDRLLWMGHGEGGVYYTSAALADGLARYNRVTLDLCAARDLECVDLAGLLPRDTTVFYDDMHFNEAGARRVAEIVAGRLRRPPGRL